MLKIIVVKIQFINPGWGVETANSEMRRKKLIDIS